VGVRRDSGVRLLLFSDLHLDRPYLWAPPAIAEARRTAAREALVSLLGEARTRSVDAIACAGDLFDRRTVKPASLRWLTAALRSTGVPVLVAPGNEDYVGPLGGYSSHEWPDNVTVFDTDRFAPVELGSGVTVWAAAHTEAHRTRSLLDGFTVDRQGVNLALFHGADIGGRDREPESDPCATFTEAALERAGIDHALVGHYRHHHFGARHTYPGAPLAHDFGPSATGGAVLVTVTPGGAVDREYFPVPSPGLHEIEVDLTGATSPAEVMSRAGSSLTGWEGVVRVTLTGRLSPDVELRREDFDGLAGPSTAVIVGFRAGVDVDVDTLRDEPTIRGQFVRDVHDAGLADDRRDSVLRIGLRALAGHSELEALR
jgi:DNA repair exonuclease SbcCD nuclease subunit